MGEEENRKVIEKAQKSMEAGDYRGLEDLMHEDVVQIYEEQREIGYASTLVEGEDDCQTYMETMFADWQAKGITVLLHEKRGLSPEDAT